MFIPTWALVLITLIALPGIFLGGIAAWGLWGCIGYFLLGKHQR